MTNDKLQEECGILGIWGCNASLPLTAGSVSGYEAAEILYYGLYGIQHRGQQSAGIAVIRDMQMLYRKELGLVSEVFNEYEVAKLRGAKSGIGHVGYNIESDNIKENAQPFIFSSFKGQAAISYNGCITNAKVLRSEYLENAYMFQTTSDAEIIAAMLTKESVKHETLEEALVQVIKKITGSYSFLVLTPDKMIAVRDPYGMKPLCLGKLDDSYVISSESAGLDTIGASFERDVIPGEIITISDKGLKSMVCEKRARTAMCIFEFVYLARSDSKIDGASVYQARFEAGKMLAREYPVEADLIMGVPDSGLPAALGYSDETGIRYAEGLIRNRYIGRTFIQQSQNVRELAVGLKLNPIRSQIEGKRIILIDDSIVRGTTSKKIVQMLKETGGAKEVHMRISSPPVKFSCYYGIDTPDKAMLIANRMTQGEMRDSLGADSLAFISLGGLLKTTVGAKCSFCSACFDGCYPIKTEEDE